MAEAEQMDPQQLHLVNVCRAVLHPGAEVIESTSVFVGISGSDYGLLKSRVELSRTSAFAATGCDVSIAAGRLSFLFNLTGAAVAVDTACSSALVAYHLATRESSCGCALVAAVNVMLTA